MAAWYGCAARQRAFKVKRRHGKNLVLSDQYGATHLMSPDKLEANGYRLLATKPRYAGKGKY
ncbi:MAG: hypothetical protein AB7U92_25115 [Piscinibacter sp.]|uniref:hypothetical protein n=1 Tax=Piscinibacter sp. TaxID=1903157 RepID=UPI003D09DCE6